MRAQSLLHEAVDLISGERTRQHGDPVVCHQRIADLWSSYLGHRIGATDAALMLLLVKVARTRSGTLNSDDFRDAAGYAALAGQIAEQEVRE
jgi:hypothetical protein